jgi:hypothetical protein
MRCYEDGGVLETRTTSRLVNGTRRHFQQWKGGVGYDLPKVKHNRHPDKVHRKSSGALYVLSKDPAWTQVVRYDKTLDHTHVSPRPQTRSEPRKKPMQP